MNTNTNIVIPTIRTIHEDINKRDTIVLFTLDVFDELVRNIPATTIKNIIRGTLIKTQSYMTPIKENIDTLASLLKGKRVFDMGCGSGSLTYLLSNMGIDIDAYDLEEPTYCFDNSHTYVYTSTDLTDICRVKPDVVILSWPDYDSGFAYRVATFCLLESIPIYYLGEGYGGWTGDDEFHDLLANAFTCDEDTSLLLNSTYRSYPCIYDKWSVFIPKY